jgi:hypothetical protein
MTENTVSEPYIKCRFDLWSLSFRYVNMNSMKLNQPAVSFAGKLLVLNLQKWGETNTHTLSFIIGFGGRSPFFGNPDDVN